MQERGETLHQNEDGHGEGGPHGEREKCARASRGASRSHPEAHHHLPENVGELRVREGQRPQSEIGRSVGYRTLKKKVASADGRNFVLIP